MRRPRSSSAGTPPRFVPADEQALSGLRSALLAHHRILLEVARFDYERIHGRVQSPGELMRLLLHDPDFGWLRALSSSIAWLDEILEEPNGEAARALVQTVSRMLLEAEPEDVGFRVPYHDALQRSPDVVLSHGRLAGLLRGMRGMRFGLHPGA